MHICCLFCQIIDTLTEEKSWLKAELEKANERIKEQEKEQEGE